MRLDQSRSRSYVEALEVATIARLPIAASLVRLGLGLVVHFIVPTAMHVHIIWLRLAKNVILRRQWAHKLLSTFTGHDFEVHIEVKQVDRRTSVDDAVHGCTREIAHHRWL